MTDILIKNDDLTLDGRLKEQYPDIDGDFSCGLTKISSLVGSPVKVGGNLNISITLLKSLIGAPMVVGGKCFFSGAKITSLQGIGKDYLQEIGGILYMNGCFSLKSNMLGIMLVKKLKGIGFNSNKEVEDIFNRHLKGDRDLLDCKEELMNNGYKEFAKL